MALEAVQAQAGHASIESTRIYLHLANDWLAREYLAAAEAIDAQLDPLAAGARVVSRLERDPQVEELVAAYRADLRGRRHVRGERGHLAGAVVPVARRL